MSTREVFLDRVRHAVVEGNRVGHTPPLPERGGIAYQGAGLDPIGRFCAELTLAGGEPFVAPDRAAAWSRIQAIVLRHQARKIVLGVGGLLEQLDIANRLRDDGALATSMNDLAAATFRDTLFAADIGITNVEHLIAETGSVVMATRPDEPRSLSLLPPVHIALAHPQQILPDLFDLFDLFAPVADSHPTRLPPSCLAVITGPSKTGDIELKLVTGVHGPGEIHVIIVE